MTKIILSYRRADSADIAGRIRDRFAAFFGEQSVFMDIDNIPFGTDFREYINEALHQCDMVVAIIGPDWVGARKGGRRRIDEESDSVRVEIETAIKRGIPLIPVLVSEAEMPSAESLPEGLRPLAYRNAAEVDTGRDFHQHIERLIRSIEVSLRASAERKTGRTPERPAEAAVPLGLAAATVDPATVTTAAVPPRRKNLGLVLAAVLFVGVAVASIVALVGYRDQPTGLVIASVPEPQTGASMQEAPVPVQRRPIIVRNQIPNAAAPAATPLPPLPSNLPIQVPNAAAPPANKIAPAPEPAPPPKGADERPAANPPPKSGDSQVSIAKPVPTPEIKAPPPAKEPPLRMYVGLNYRSTTDADAARLRISPKRGATVVSVIPDSPAAQAGLRADDVVIRARGIEIIEQVDLARIIRETPHGEAVRVTIIRNGRYEDLTVRPEDIAGAVARGNAYAIFTLAGMYQRGDALPKDAVEARRLYEKAAALNEPRAMTSLGQMYRNGEGVARDDKQALDWYRKAAALGDPRGTNNVGTAYRLGEGVDRDEKQALEWYRKAAALGHAGAMNDLGFMYGTGTGGVERDYKQALDWYRKAAALDQPNAVFNLGAYYWNGTGVDRDAGEARRLWEHAASLNNVNAMVRLGMVHEQGTGVPVDLEKAQHWYTLAANAGNADAKKALDRLKK